MMRVYLVGGCGGELEVDRLLLPKAVTIRIDGSIRDEAFAWAG